MIKGQGGLNQSLTGYFMFGETRRKKGRLKVKERKRYDLCPQEAVMIGIDIKIVQKKETCK